MILIYVWIILICAYSVSKNQSGELMHLLKKSISAYYYKSRWCSVRAYFQGYFCRWFVWQAVSFTAKWIYTWGCNYLIYSSIIISRARLSSIGFAYTPGAKLNSGSYALLEHETQLAISHLFVGVELFNKCLPVYISGIRVGRPARLIELYHALCCSSDI